MAQADNDVCCCVVGFILGIVLVLIIVSSSGESGNNCKNLRCELIEPVNMTWYTWYDGQGYFFNEEYDKNIEENDTVKCRLKKQNVSLGKC